MRWHQQTTTQVIEELRTSAEGLPEAETRRRLAEYGANALAERAPRTPYAMLLDQFRDFMIIVLIAAAVLSGVIGDVTDTVAIVVIVILNAIIGFVQEYRAERAMAALKRLAAPAATVLRDGQRAVVPATDLVPGDVVVLEAGNLIPADLRVIEAVQFRVEEAALTGESHPVEKHTELLHDEHLPVGDRTNMAFKGTIVSYGRGSGVVVATGMETELGQIATMLQEEEEVRTPLQRRLTVFGQRLAVAVLVICAVVLAAGILRGEPVVLMFLTAISLAVAAIPEALPAVVTISLALGARKMVRQHALIRRLPAVETLGSVTYICSDKTGTLTENRMAVEELLVDSKRVTRGADRSGWLDEVRSSSEEPARELFEAMALSNDAGVGADGEVTGDPTEVALVRCARDAGLGKEALSEEHPRVAEVPFDSDRKRMTTFHRSGSEVVSYTKGAVEVLLERSTKVMTSRGPEPLDAEELHKVAEQMAADGLRVLAVAMRTWPAVPADLKPDHVERDLVLLGLVGILDPPREEAKEAVALCRSAGIKPVMITGDHPATARAIAMRLGIVDDNHAVMTGRQLERLPPEEFERRVEDIRVYARVAPDQKLKIVKALQDRGQFVAMTGDGVNDAPALRRADIGVAMGITGTDVAKQAAHMVLLDDNFATIVKAVREGRRLFDNIRKFIKYTMTSNSGEILVIFFAPFLGLPIPLLPIHLLWINLVTDGLPGLALAAEPAEKGIMERPPRAPNQSLFSEGLGVHIVWVGVVMASVVLLLQAWAIHSGEAHWQTMVFTTLCLSQMGHVMAIRSSQESLFQQGLRSNVPLLGAFLLTLGLQLGTVYIPAMNPIFHTEPLTLDDLGIVLAASSIVFVAVEIEKWWKRRTATGREVPSTAASA